MSDLYDRLEARHEAHERAAREMAAVMGVGKRSDDKARDDKPRDDEGRFVVGTADAGERGAPVMPTPTMGAMIASHIFDDPSYRNEA